MKHIWKKSPAAHLLFACLLSIALLPGCIQDPYELQQGLDRISFGATTAAPDGGASTKGGDGLSLLADGWFVALGAEEGSDVAWQPELQTKTSYSGYDEDGNLISNTAGTAGTNTTSAYERIDWVTGDSVTVISRQAYVRDRSTTPPGTVQSHGTYSRMNYGVADLGAPSGQNHSARLSPADGEGLLWDNNNSTHYFLAVYPATTEDNFSLIGTSNNATFSAEIPASQPPKGQRTLTENGRQVLEFLPDMGMVYMYATANGSRSNGSNVALNFKPMVSAARFTIRAADVGGGTLKMTKATLSTSRTGTFSLCGKMNLRVDYSNSLSNVSYTETGQSISIPLDNVQLGDRDIRLTFITLAQMGYLTLTLEFEGGITRSLQLKRGNNFINISQRLKAYFDLAGISYMPSYDLPDAIWGWTEDVLPAPAPQNVLDGDDNPVTNPGVSYYFKDGVGTDAVATVSGNQITCGTSAGKRILVARVTVGPVTAETEIPVYVQKLDRVEIDEPAGGHNVRVGANYTLPYTVYWSRPKADGTLEEMSTTDAAEIYNATTADLAGFYPEASIPAASQTYLTLGTKPGTVKGLAPVALPGVPVTLSITDGSHGTKPTHRVSDDTNVFVTDPPFTSAAIVYHIPSYAETQYDRLTGNLTGIFAGDGEVGRIFTVMAEYDDGTYDLYDYTDVAWHPADPTLIDITAEGYVTVPRYTASGNSQNTTITADFTDRYGVSRQVTREFSIVKPTLYMYRSSGPNGSNPVSASYQAGGTAAGGYTNLPHDVNWNLSPGILLPQDDDYVQYFGAAGWQNYPYNYLIGASAYYVLKVSTLPAGYTFGTSRPYVDARRDLIPYAEQGYRNHKNLHSPLSAWGTELSF